MIRKQVKKKSGPWSSILEHVVPFDFIVVGTQEWFDNAWEPGEVDKLNVIVFRTIEDLQPVFSFLEANPVHGIDTETTGPDIKDNKGYSMNPVNPETRMVTFQIGNKDTVYIVEPELLPYFKPYLESDKYLHLLHNAIYDFKWLLVKYGIHLIRIYCSMLAEQVLTAGLPSRPVNLMDTVRRYEPHWIINKQIRSTFINMDAEGRKITAEMAFYAARDIVLMFPVMTGQAKEIKKWKLEATCQLEFDVIPATAEMEIQGVTVSLPVMKQIIEYWESQELKIGERILQLFTEEREDKKKETLSLFPDLRNVFNLKSNAAKLKALREIDINLDNVQRESLKEYSKDTSISVRGREITKNLAEFSRITKMTSTYGKNIVDKINPNTNRWHPKFKQLGSGEEESRNNSGEDSATIATGRFSSDAQQFPKPKELFVNIENEANLKILEAIYKEKIEELKEQYGKK